MEIQNEIEDVFALRLISMYICMHVYMYLCYVMCMGHAKSTETKSGPDVAIYW